MEDPSAPPETLDGRAVAAADLLAYECGLAGAIEIAEDRAEAYRLRNAKSRWRYWSRILVTLRQQQKAHE